MKYVFQVYDREEGQMRFVGRSDEGRLVLMAQEAVVEMLVAKFKATAPVNGAYPYMNLVAIAKEFGLDREDEAVDKAWDKV